LPAGDIDRDAGALGRGKYHAPCLGV
jgi:hypothetical protein